MSSTRRLVCVCEGVLYDPCRAIEMVRLEKESLFGLGCTCGVITRVYGVLSSGSIRLRG